MGMFVVVLLFLVKDYETVGVKNTMTIADCCVAIISSAA